MNKPEFIRKHINFKDFIPAVKAIREKTNCSLEEGLEKYYDLLPKEKIDNYISYELREISRQIKFNKNQQNFRRIDNLELLERYFELFQELS